MNLGRWDVAAWRRRRSTGCVAESLLSQVVHSFLLLRSFPSVRGKLVLDALTLGLRRPSSTLRPAPGLSAGSSSLNLVWPSILSGIGRTLNHSQSARRTTHNQRQVLLIVLNSNSTAARKVPLCSPPHS